MGKIKVNVANASSDIIVARFVGDQLIETKAHHSAYIGYEGFGINGKRKVESDYISGGGKGKSSISPGVVLPLSEITQTGRAKLTIMRRNKRTVTKDYTVTEDTNFIVTDRDLIATKYKKACWIDDRGVNYEHSCK